MRWYHLAILGLMLAAAAWCPTTQARPDTPPTVAFDGKPAHSGGQLKAKGTYSLGNNAALTVVSVTLHVSPVEGGKLESDTCKWKDGKWTGAISDLPPGEYNCRATLVVKDGRGKESTLSAKIVKVTISAAKPVARHTAGDDR